MNTQQTHALSLRIAIVIRTKNRPHLLNRCLQSLAAQMRIPDEIIVVNDGGSAINKIISNFPDLPIQLLNHTVSQGRSRAGNVGVQAAHSEVIGFLDDDDRFLPDHLQRLEQAMLSFDTPVVYSGCYLVQRDITGAQPLTQEKIIGQYNESFSAERLRYENYIPLINLLINRDLWLKVGGFDESFNIFEDWDILSRLSEQTNFYHLDRITAEYTIWGTGQITQSLATQQWKDAYRQFLEKHLMPLSYAEKIKLLAHYWMVSQERRSAIQKNDQENQALQREKQASQLELLKKQQEILQLTQEMGTYKALTEEIKIQLATRQSQNEHLHNELAKRDQKLADLQQALVDTEQRHARESVAVQQKYNLLLAEVEQRHQQRLAEVEQRHQQRLTEVEQRRQQELTEVSIQLTEAEQRHEQQLADTLVLLEDIQKKYVELEKAANLEYQQRQWLENTTHELSKQTTIGINATTVERVLAARPVTAYSLAASSGGVLDDYRRLLAWIRGKVQQLNELSQQLPVQMSPARQVYQELRTQIAELQQFISASHWPQVRRYAEAVQTLDNQLVKLFAEIENVLAEQQNIGDKVGLNQIIPRAIEAETPPLRPLSAVYPTFASIAGTLEKPQFMEVVTELGAVPFLLNSGAELAFTTNCTLNHFFRIDIMLATRLRINTCQVRVFIRELPTGTVVRAFHLDGAEIFDNYFYPLTFEPIIDSAGKIYQIELDSPDANEQAGLAVWCHPKAPNIQQQRLEEYSPARLPQWVRHSLLSTPLPANLTSEVAIHLLMISGIDENTQVFDLHLWLLQMAKALEKADSTAKVVICGQLNCETQDYCQKQQLVSLDSAELPTVLNFGKNQDSAHYLWYCDLNALPQIDVIERAKEMFTDNPTTSILVPLEKRTDGTIRAGHALVVRDGVINPLSVGKPADHPYYGYRRPVDAASSTLVVIKITDLPQLDIDVLTAYRTPLYQVAEMIWQFKQQEQQAFYAAALCYQNDQPFSFGTDKAFNQDCQRFYQRWQAQLPTQMPLFSHLTDVLNPQRQPTVLIIDATLPTFDEDSGSLRLYTLMKIWGNLGYRLTFFPDNLDSNFKYRHALEALGVEVFHGNYRIQDALAYRQFDFAFICRVDIGQRYIPFVRLLSPKTVIFYDTVDIHYIREQRQAEIENNPKLALSAEATKRKELSNCLLANRVITVTEDDGRHLQKEVPNLAFSVIPNIHTLPALSTNSFADRDGLVFIGNYNHTPNEDAVLYFVEQVLPKIHAITPEICFYVIGSNMKESLKALANEYVKIVGWVDVVEPEFAKRRVFVSYLRYGAGMKGKLGQALSLGLPVVTTTVGAEGMGLVEAETALIADDPDNFAQAVCRLYNDSLLWEKLARLGREYVEHHYGAEAVREKLQNWLKIFK